MKALFTIIIIILILCTINTSIADIQSTFKEHETGLSNTTMGTITIDQESRANAQKYEQEAIILQNSGYHSQAAVKYKYTSNEYMNANDSAKCIEMLQKSISEYEKYSSKLENIIYVCFGVICFFILKSWR